MGRRWRCGEDAEPTSAWHLIPAFGCRSTQDHAVEKQQAACAAAVVLRATAKPSYSRLCGQLAATRSGGNAEPAAAPEERSFGRGRRARVTLHAPGPIASARRRCFCRTRHGTERNQPNRSIELDCGGHKTRGGSMHVVSARRQCAETKCRA